MILERLNKLNFNDYLEIESKDRQFIALKKLVEKKGVGSLIYIILNALVCYQLSKTGEEYWEEFSEYFIENGIEGNEIENLKIFLDKCNGNKRLVKIKQKRLEKAVKIVEKIKKNKLFYYKNMEKLLDLISKEMKQKKDAKTVVFAIKMFGYGARIAFNEVITYPKEINIPIDSRLTNLYEKGGEKSLKIEDFYIKLSKDKNIPPLHLDSVLWVNYNYLMGE